MRNTIFKERPEGAIHDDKSVEQMMQEELHNECFMQRCFESAKQVKQQVTVVGRKYQPKKSKKTKNPIFWKPDPLRYSKHM